MLMGSNIPLSVSLLSDFTMPAERGIAQSIYAAGVYLGVGMSSISVLFDGAVGWRNTIRIICGISWALCIPMFFVPEPIRNETNRLAAIEVKKAVANQDNFDNLALRADDTAGPSDDVTDSNKPLMEKKRDSTLNGDDADDLDVSRRDSVFEVDA